jgi:hypothetical protein
MKVAIQWEGSKLVILGALTLKSVKWKWPTQEISKKKFSLDRKEKQSDSLFTLQIRKKETKKKEENRIENEKTFQKRRNKVTKTDKPINADFFWPDII